MHARATVAFLLLAAWGGATAQQIEDADWPLVPGRLGYNALPVLPNADPAIGPRGELQLEAAAQLSGVSLAQAAATPYFRLTLPFREVAALEIDGSPFELWRTDAATQARLLARDRSGIAQGDLRFGARFLVFEEREPFPALGVRFVVRSTTGTALHSRRFTNAPGFQIDVLSGKDVGAVGPARLRAFGHLGLGVWQFGPGRQDDALAYGLTLRAAFAGGEALLLEWRGYTGWRFDDRPSVLGFTARAPVGRVDVHATVNAGLSSDAPPFEMRIGFTRAFDMPAQTRSRRPDRPAPPPVRPPGPSPVMLAGTPCTPASPERASGAEPRPCKAPASASTMTPAVLEGPPPVRP